jgi:hypothetical protein
MVRYDGYYSNVTRGKRMMQKEDKLIPSVLESDEWSKERRKNWGEGWEPKCMYELDLLTPVGVCRVRGR